MPVIFAPPSTAAAATPATTINTTFVPGVVAGDFVYFTGVGDQVDRADASGVATGFVIGLCTAINTPAPGQCNVVLSGDSGPIFAGLTPGVWYVQSTTLGLILPETAIGNPAYPNTTPGSGEVLQRLGSARTAAVLIVNVGVPTVF
jgi:hypothetical protein